MANYNDGRINLGIDLQLNRTSLAQLRSELQQLSTMSFDSFFNRNSNLGIQQARRQFQQLKTDVNEVQIALTRAFNSNLGSLNISRLNTELGRLDLQRIYRNFQAAGSAGTAAFNSISSATLKTNLQLRESHKFLDEIAVTFKNTVKWTMTSSAVNRMSDAIQAAWQFTKGLDTDLNDIRIVTGKSADEMERFARQANKAAQDLGAATRDYTQASLIFYQQGLSDTEVQARTNVVLKAANVTGQQASEVSEQLTAVWNGYRVSAEETEAYVDKLAAVGANTASNLEELSTAMSKVASAANTAGVPIDNLNAILSTVISVTREAPETIGTAFKTIFARLGDLSLGGTDEEGVGLGNVSTKLHNLGVEVLDQQGNMREMGDIIEDVAAKWQTWTRAQQQAAAVAMAGKMQYSRLISLFENWDMYTVALNTSQEALGTLQEQQEIYMDSTAAHLQQLQTAWDRVSNAMVDNQSMNSLIDVLTQLTIVFANFTEAIGGGGTALLMFGAIMTNVFQKQMAQGINSMINNRNAARNNREMLNRQIQALEVENQAASGQDIGTRTRLEERQRMNRYIGSMSNEQITREFDAIDQLANVRSQRQQYEQNEREAAHFIQNLAQQQRGQQWSEQDALTALNENQHHASNHQKYKDMWQDAKFELEGYIADVEKITIAQNQYTNAVAHSEEALKAQANVEQQINTINQRKTAMADEERRISQRSAYNQRIINNPNSTSEQINAAQQREIVNTERLNQLRLERTEIDQKLNQLNNQYSNILTNVSNSEDRVDNKLGAYIDKIKLLQTLLTNMSQRKDLSPMQSREVEKALRELNNINLADESTINTQATTRAVQNAMNAIRNGVEDINQQNENVNNQIQARNQHTIEQLNNDIIEGEANIKNFHDEGQRLISIEQNFLNVASALMQIASSIMMIQNLGNIWTDEDLSIGEKLLQTTMSLSMIAMQTGPLIFELYRGIKEQRAADLALQQLGITAQNRQNASLIQEAVLQSALNKAKAQGEMIEVQTVAALTAEQRARLMNTYATAGEIAAINAATGAQIGFNTAVLANPYLLIAVGVIAAIASIAVAIGKATEAYNADANAAQEAANAAKELSNNYEELNTAAETLRKTISDYEDGVNELSKLTKGTEEYKTALEEANSKAKDLIETYKLYDQIYMEDGLIKFNDGVLKTLETERIAAASQAEITKYNAQIAANQASLRSQTTNTRRDTGIGFDIKNIFDDILALMPGLNTTLGVKAVSNDFVKITNDQVTNIVSALNKVREANEAQYLSITKSDEAFEKWVRTTYNGDSSMETLAKQIGKNRDEFIALADKTRDLIKANEYYMDQLNAAAISNKYKDALGQMATNAKTDQIDEDRYKQLVNVINNSAIQEQLKDFKQERRNILSEQQLDVGASWSKEFSAWWWNWGVPGSGNQSDLNKYLDDTLRNFGVSKELVGTIKNNETLAKEYAKSVKQMTTEQINALTWANNKLQDEAGNVIVDASGAEQRGQLRAQLLSTAVNQTGDTEIDNMGQKMTEQLITTVNELQFMAAKAGAQFGTDFSGAMLNALSNPDYKFDLSGLYSRLNPDEVAQINNMSNEDIQKMLGLTNEKLALIGNISAETLAEHFRQGLIDYKWDIDEALTSAMELKSSDLEEYGGELSTKKFNEYKEDVEVYAKNLMQIAESADTVADSLKYDADTAVDFAYKIIKMNKAIDTLADNMEDWSDIIQHSSRTSQEYAESMYNLRNALADVYDTSMDYISNDFVAQHLSEIEKIATGDEVAIENLRDALSQDVILNILVKNDIANRDDILSQFVSLREQAQAAMSDLVIGDDIFVDDTNFVNSLNKLIEDCQMTVEQANAVFSALGVEPTYATEIVTQTQRNPVIQTDTYTTQEPSTEMSYVGPDGVTHTLSAPNFSQIQTSRTVGYTEENVEVPITAIAANGKQPKISGIKKAPTGSFNNYSSINKGGKAPGKSSKKSSGSKKEPKSEDYLKDEKDFYHDINLELKKYETELGRLQNAQEKLFGQHLIDNYNQQLTNLNNTIDATNRKIEIARGELQLIRNYLAERGVLFDSEGYISNYTEIYEQKLRETNGIIDAYNKMSAEEQENYKDIVDKAKKDFEEFVENIEQYDSVISDLIPGLIDDIQEAMDKEIEISISKFNMAIELELDTAKMEKDWAKFQRRIIKNITDKNFGYIVDKAQDMVKEEFKIFYDENNSGIIQRLTQQIADTQRELEQIQATGWSKIYGDNEAQALEDLKNYHSQLREQMEDYQDMIDEVRASFGELMNEAAGRIEEQIDLYGQIRKQITHDMNVIKMLYGEDEYEALAPYYQQQHEQFKTELEFQRNQVELYKDAMNAAESNFGKESEEWRNARKLYIDAIEAWEDKTEEALQNVIDKYINAIDKIFKDLENEVTSGTGLDYVGEQWELITKSSDMYLDNLNAMYEVEKLNAKYQDAFDKTSSLSAQAKIREMQEAEMKDLRERDKLSQYDIERANLKYELLLRQIALEEAQQNKSTLRLRRDSQGNYTYQYVADEDQIDDLRQQVTDVYNELYNLDRDRYRENLDQMYDIYSEFHQKMRDLAANTTMDVEEKERWKALYTEQYGQMINDIVGDNELIRQNLIASTYAHHINLMDVDRDTYEAMTDAETKDTINKFIDTANPNSILSTHGAAFETIAQLQTDTLKGFEAMDDAIVKHTLETLAPGWSEGVQRMVDVFAKAKSRNPDNAFDEIVGNAIAQVDNAMLQYGNDVEEVSSRSTTAFNILKNDGLDPTVESTKNLVDETSNVITQYRGLLDTLTGPGGVLQELNNLTTQYNGSAEAARNAATATYEYITALQNQMTKEAEAEKQRQAIEQAKITDATKAVSRINTPSSTGISSGSGSGTGSGSSSGTNGNGTNLSPTAVLPTSNTNTQKAARVGSTVTVNSGSTFLRGTNGNLGEDATMKVSNGSFKVAKIDSSHSPWTYLLQDIRSKADVGWFKSGSLNIQQYRTGGYTGDWIDDSGKLAVLHKKELVLNATDTENILAAVDAIRSLTLGRLSPQSGITTDITATANDLNQNVHIDATFPNVHDAKEIEDALNNLTNRASQYAARK